MLRNSSYMTFNEKNDSQQLWLSHCAPNEAVSQLPSPSPLVRMSSGERPIGAAKGKQSYTETLCQPPPPCASTAAVPKRLSHKATYFSPSLRPQVRLGAGSATTVTRWCSGKLPRP